LAEEEDLVDVVVLLGTDADARVNLLELVHDRKHILGHDLRRGAVRGQVGLVGTEHYWHVHAERTEVWHPEQSNPFIAVVVRVYEEDNV